VWWGLLFGVLFFIPVFGMAVGAGLGALMGKVTKTGIDSQCQDQVRGMLKPGTGRPDSGGRYGLVPDPVSRVSIERAAASTGHRPRRVMRLRLDHPMLVPRRDPHRRARTWQLGPCS
jgi:hypothetical protein